MKKLFLILLLVSSFSANALSIKIAAPCLDDESIAKKSIIQERKNDINLSNLDKDSSAYKEQVNELNKYKADFIFPYKGKIDDLESNFFNILFMLSEKCKKSPEGNLVNGKRDGSWIWYDEYNEWTKYGFYINGIKDGFWTEGSAKGNYINGNRDGTWSYSYSFGEVYKEEIYDNGVLIEKKFL
jgi:hypothetical protein